MTIYVLYDRENEATIACREEFEGYTDLLPDDATSYNGVPLVPIAEAPLDACYIILCDTAEEVYDYLDDGA